MEKHPLTQLEMIRSLLHSILRMGFLEGRVKLKVEPRSIVGEIKKILIIQLTSLGDVVCSTPIIKALKEKFQGCSVSFLTEEGGGEILSLNPYVDDIIIFRRDYYAKSLCSGKPIEGLMREVFSFVSELQRRRFDLVLNLHVTFLSAFITYLAGGRNIEGFVVDEFGKPKIMGSLWNFYKYYVVTNNLMKDRNKLNLVELHLKMAEVNPAKRELEASIGYELKMETSNLLEEYGINGDDLVIGIAPGSNFKAKMWEEEKFAALADELCKRYGAKVIFFGGKGEVELIGKIVELMQGECINLAGKTTLRDLAALISRCNYFISVDSAPMHIAAMVKIPTIVLCGPTRMTPYGVNHLVLQANLPCVGTAPTSSCFSCKRRECMESILVEDVLNSLQIQRGELKEWKNSKVNLYTTGEELPTRLFSCYPIRKKKCSGEDLAKEIISIISLNLWIKENNRKRGFVEEPISPVEASIELMKWYQVDAITSGISKARERLHFLSSLFDEGVELLKRINSKNIDKFNELNRATYKDEGEVLSFLDFLFLSKKPTQKEWLVLYKAKREACREMEELLNQVEEEILSHG